MFTVIFSHPKYGTGSEINVNAQRSPLAPQPPHTCWCCRMLPSSLWTLLVSQASPSLRQSHKRGENAPLGHESSRPQGLGCWRLHQAIQRVWQEQTLILKTILLVPKEEIWLSPNLTSLSREYLERQIHKCLLTPIALQPLLVLATRQPSVVAIGTWNSFPSKHRGPATPTGIGMYPITFSQQAPIT